LSIVLARSACHQQPTVGKKGVPGAKDVSLKLPLDRSSIAAFFRIPNLRGEGMFEESGLVP
jgi:hypothetical protein